MTDIADMRSYVSEKLSGWSPIHGILYEFMKDSDIPRTMNANGMFVNLTAIPDNDVRQIYEKLEQCGSYTDQAEEDLQDIHVVPPPPKKPKTVLLKKIPLTKIQHRILSHL